MSVPQRIAITGASGLIGSALVGHLKSEGHTVQRLVRRATVAPDEIQWDPKTGYVDIEALRGVDAVIHLAGVGVGDKRWTKRYKSEILNSRLLGTTAIANAVAEVKPQVFISASAIGWYGDSGNRAVVETDSVGNDFLAAVCREWEGAADLAGEVRTVKLRTGWFLIQQVAHLVECCRSLDLALVENLVQVNNGGHGSPCTMLYAPSSSRLNIQFLVP
jgi:uncharacterized protein (TIGR01777 family)